jgi:ribonuclease M5
MEIEELLVVEGKNDAQVLRRALGAVEVLWTEGFGLTAEKLAYIKKAAAQRGVIVCTDPDHAGESIRARLDRQVPGLKHVYLPRREALNAEGTDIGWENASLDAVRAAFALVRTTRGSAAALPGAVTMQDLIDLGLAGAAGAAAKRRELGARLGIGECNAKQFLQRLRRFDLERDFLQREMQFLR